MGFPQLLSFVAVLLAFALAIIFPFLWHLNRKEARERAAAEAKEAREMVVAEASQNFHRERSEACHGFQKELNAQTLVGFTKVTNALNLNTQVLNKFMEHTDRNATNEPRGPVQ